MPYHDQLAAELESRLNEWDLLENQYLLFVKASILQHNQGDAREVLELLMDGIHITMPDFKENGNVKSRLLTFDEITILNSIALQYDKLGNLGKSLKLLCELKNYMEEHEIDEVEKAKKYPMLLYNIANRLGKMGLYQEAYNLCSAGIGYCIKCNKLVALPYLLTDKACAAAEIDKHDEAVILFQQAAMLYTICKKEWHADYLRRELLRRYNIDIYQDPSIKSPKKNPTT